MANEKENEQTEPPAQLHSFPANFFSRGRDLLARCWGLDFVCAATAVLVILFGTIIWYQPPLIRAHFPRVSYSFLGKSSSDAELYRPLAMPTRYYVKLPHKLRKRYHWFSVDRRSEICALTEPPRHSLFGIPAIRRGDSQGLDLEFRHIDNSEWQVGFFEDSIVFSNDILCIRLDTQKSR